MKTCVSSIKAITMIKELNAGLKHVTWYQEYVDASFTE